MKRFLATAAPLVLVLSGLSAPVAIQAIVAASHDNPVVQSQNAPSVVILAQKRLRKDKE